MKRFLPLLLSLLPLPLVANTTEAENLVRQGKNAEALAAVGQADATPEACYWKGRALVNLQRFAEAAGAFSKVPQEHALYPYAAKGLIYCAWKSNVINFVEAVAPLTISPDKDIAALATAALAEFQLRHTQSGDTASLDELRRLVGKHPELSPVLRLLEVENLRRHGKYEEATALCREIESDKSLSLPTHHRARLALAEVYYAREEANAGKAVNDENGESDEDGMGEETLLQFISANPESPLLHEAFRRLVMHRAFTTSKYAIRRLQEWRDDLSKPRRAALALLMQQRAAFAGQDDVTGPALANAASAMPGETAARVVIMEQTRALLAQGDKQGAELFLSLLPSSEDDPYQLFFRAGTLPPASPEAKEMYLRSAENATGELQPAALSNALFCAFKGGDKDTVEKLLKHGYPRHVRRALLLTYAALQHDQEPGRALDALQELETLAPSPFESAEALLVRAGITMETDPPATLATLLSVPDAVAETWLDGQLLRLYQLQLEAVDRLTNDSPTQGIERARKILESCQRPAIACEIGFNLVRRLFSAGLFGEAYARLEHLVDIAPTPHTKARALLLAGETAARLGSQSTLDKSIELFELCAAIPSPYARRADALRGRVLMWTNRLPESIQLLQGLLRHEEELSMDDRALAYTALADSYSLLGTEEGTRSAIEYSSRLQEIPQLSAAWRTRGMLQHAALSARSGRHEDALKDYMGILDSYPDNESVFTRAQWFVLSYAGSGAIYQYLQLKEFDKAADLAESIAERFRKHTDPKSRETQEARLFADWAADIRRNNY